MKTGESGTLFVEGKQVFARKIPHEAFGYDLGTNPSLYTIPITITIRETSLPSEARRDVVGLSIHTWRKFYRFEIHIPGDDGPLWLTRSHEGYISAYKTMTTTQSWKIQSVGKDPHGTSELLPSDTFMLLDDTEVAYIFLDDKGALSSEKNPLTHSRWKEGFLFQIQPINQSSENTLHPMSLKASEGGRKCRKRTQEYEKVTSDTGTLMNDGTSTTIFIVSTVVLIALLVIMFK